MAIIATYQTKYLVPSTVHDDCLAKTPEENKARKDECTRLMQEIIRQIELRKLGDSGD